MPSLIILIVGIVVAFSIIAYRGFNHDMSTTKRLYFYILSFVALLVTANGLILLINFLLDYLVQPVILRGSSTERLGLSVALVVVGSALWVPHWRYIQHQLKKAPGEAESSLRKFYIYAFLFVSLVLTVISGVQLLRWALGIGSFNSGMVSPFLVWVPLWFYHWRLESKEGQPSSEAKTLRRWYVYLTSFYSLAMVAAGLGFVLFSLLRFLYNQVLPVPFLTGERQPLWGESTRTALAVAITGAPVWGWHWYKAARRDLDSTLRQVYLYLYAILLGGITILTALALILNMALTWFLGAAKEPTATAHFRSLPGAIASLLVGVGLWGYHWTTVQQESKRLAFRLLAARRAYTYFMAALGLATVAAGLIILFPTVIDIFITSARGTLVGSGWWRSRISWLLTLLIIGVPWWSYYWLNMQHQARTGGAEERSALTRRLHIYIVLVLSMLSLLGSLVFTIYLFLKEALGGAMALGVMRQAKWSIGVFITAALIAYYYWLALREDLRTGAEKIARKTQVTLLIGGEGGGLVPQLEEKLGYKLKVVHSPEAGNKIPELTPEKIEELAQRIQESQGNRVMLVVEETGIKVYSYR